MKDKQDGQIINGKPAPYPDTSPSEMTTASIFNYLVDNTFIKGPVRVLDKYPNSDGIIDITDKDQFPVGKIDIQLKTLSPKCYKTLSYSCSRSLLVYCNNSVLPMILVVVNQKEKAAYWKHIDTATLMEANNRLKGNSVSIKISATNKIDATNTTYIETWTQLAKDTRHKLGSYEPLLERNKMMEAELKEITSRFKRPNLPLIILKKLYDFIDIYNYILDREFKAVKAIIYPAYWKTGIGIIMYWPFDVRFVLYPVAFEGEQMLVRQAEVNFNTDFLKDMFDRKIFSLHMSKSGEDLEDRPQQYAYGLLEDAVKPVATTYKFPIQDIFLANEYLVSFIDAHQVVLDMEAGVGSCGLKDLKIMVYNVLPMVAATNRSFAEDLKEYEDDIDSYSHYTPSFSEGHRKKLDAARQKIADRFVAPVKVTMRSTWYDMNLITYYINYLEEQGVTEATRQYNGVLNEMKLGNDYWKRWEKERLWQNLQLFFLNFQRIYDLYLTTHFPVIKEALKMKRLEEITVICVLYFDDKQSYKPFTETYYLRPKNRRVEPGRVLCMQDGDPLCPVIWENLKAQEYNCRFEEQDYEIIRSERDTLDYLFGKSPTYYKIQELLTQRLQVFFRERRK